MFIRWICTEIVRQENSQDRASVITKFINVGAVIFHFDIAINFEGIIKTVQFLWSYGR